MRLVFNAVLCLTLMSVCMISAAQAKPADMTKVYLVGKGVTAPDPIPRDYSSILVTTCDRTKSVKTDIKLVVDAAGSPQGVSVDDSADPNINRILLQWMGTVKFKPALSNGNPVAAGISDHVQVDVCYKKETDSQGATITRLHLFSAPTHKISPWKDAPDQMQTSIPGKNPAPVDNPQRVEPMQHIVKGNGVTPPIPVYTVDPHFSEEARKKHIQGECMIQVIVDATGAIQSPRVVRPLGYGLDEKAIEAVKLYRFHPAQKDGKPIPVYMTIAINFRLR